jgi:hypothetical protein
MTRADALRRLVVIWGFGSAILATLLVIQSALGKFGADYRVAVGWGLTSVAPTLSLITTAALSDGSPRWKTGPAEPFRLRLATWVSCLYLATLIGLLVVEAFIELTWAELLSMAEMPVTAGQAIAVAAITSVIFDRR